MTKLRFVIAALSVASGWLVLVPGELIAQKRQRDRIAREEILGSPHRELDLYQVIRGLRPHFLEPPPGVRTLGGAYGPGPLAVYVDGVRETGVDALRTLTAIRVEEVRYLDPARAENEFGPRANGGAVTVKLYRPPKVVATPVPDSTPEPARDSTRPPPR